MQTRPQRAGASPAVPTAPLSTPGWIAQSVNISVSRRVKPGVSDAPSLVQALAPTCRLATVDTRPGPGDLGCRDEPLWHFNTRTRSRPGSLPSRVYNAGRR